ncbi:UGSC family (seleno)protein [Parafrankia elaeagni]|uniref:UGSC family (seleno)protein n=1 Tax=Parafrankia elaeagni TaxID=222534 RepID=UPI0003675B27|nr:hypothetical protein [Parafrankia elaeagni]
MDAQYEVVWPLGRRVADVGVPALPPRVADLNSAVVVELWDHVFRGDEVFPAVREEMRRRYPGIRFVDYNAFGNFHVADEEETLARLPEFLRAQKADAVIAGVGH